MLTPFFILHKSPDRRAIVAAKTLNGSVLVNNTIEQKHQRANELELKYLGNCTAHLKEQN